MARWPARWRPARRPAAGGSGASPISCNRCIAVVGAIAGLLMLTWGLAAQAGPNLQSFPQVLSPVLPYDVNAVAVEQQMRQVHPRNGGEYSAADADLVISAQRQFDILAWQAFLALNWPQKAWNKPAVNLNERDGSPLWSYWVPIEKIFDPGGAPPEFPWNPEKGHQEMVSKGVAASMPPKAAWRQSASANDNFQAFSGPLVDQNGKWVRYEALVNPEEFEYIFKNTLYSLDGQIAFSQRDVEHNEVDFPVNQKSRHGAIEIKLAWKELGADDDRSRFYTTTVRVRASGPPGTSQEWRPITAGLVGMHIAMHTQSSPQWIWSTFEQIDNVRRNPLQHGGMSHANFMNPDLPYAPVNVLPLKNGGCKDGMNCGSWYENLTTTPVQVARISVPTQPGLNELDAKIAAETQALNAEVQALLREIGSVFQYYELIGTQWPVHKFAPGFAGGQGSAPQSISNKLPGDVVPVFLINTAMETYFQKGPQNAGCLEQDDRLNDNCVADTTQVVGTESCAGCHYSAGICIGYRRAADGTKVPIYGISDHSGRTGHANFSWMLQIETAKQAQGAATH
jgi:hypothetical protein